MNNTKTRAAIAAVCRVYVIPTYMSNFIAAESGVPGVVVMLASIAPRCFGMGAEATYLKTADVTRAGA